MPPRRRVLLALGVLVLLGLLSLLFHRPLLHAAARAWIVNDSVLEPVDAVLIPGGGLATRPFGAAELFHQGLAGQVVAFHVELSPDQTMGVTAPQHEATLEILDELGIPPHHITVIGESVTSTWDEVLATRAWCEENDIRSLAIVTEIFPSRRGAWAYQKGLKDLDTTVQVVALDPAQYQASNWWRHERGLIQFQNELIKHLYYRVRY